MPRESTIQILRSTSTDTPTGLTFGELAYSDVNGKLFVGRTGGASLWVGAGITTGSISTNSATLVPTQSAVKTYVDGVVGGGSVVNSLNGTGGAITITGDGGSQLVTVSGTTTTLSNRLASATVTGVASFGNEFVVTSGAVGLTSNYVRSINGITGALGLTVSGNLTLTMTGADNKTFRLYSKPFATVKGTAGAIAWADTGATFAGDGVDLGAENTFKFNYLTDLSLETPGSFKLGTFYGAASFIQFGDGTTQGTAVKPLPLASATVTGVASFGNEFVVTSGAVGLTSNYVRSVNGLTGAVVSIATTGSNVFTGLNTFNAGISGTSATLSGDIAVNGGDITTTSATATVFNTTATNLSIGGAATSLTIGATSGGAASIRSGTITLGSSSSTFVVTPAGTANDLYISPNGNLILAPTSNPGDGTNTTLYINGSPDAQGQVQINGGDLYLGTKSVDGAVYTPVNVIFEGSGNVDSNKTTLTVVNPTANRTITLPNNSGTVALVDTTVASVNGATGAITITGAGAITYTQSGTSNTINARLASTSLTGVASFNSTRFTVSGAGAVDLAAAFQVTGDTVVAGNAITATRSGNSVTVDNNGVRSFNSATGAVSFAVPLASASVTGVASFGNEFVVTSGAVGLTSNYVRSVNGLTGAVVSIATTGSNTFTGLQTMNAGLTANHLYVTNGATFASRIQGVGATFTGIVEIDTGLILPNGQNITSAVTTFNGASGAVSFAVPLASASVTGVASFGNEFVVTSGAVGLTSNYTKSINGATGAITITGAGAITYTQSGTSNTINARLASTSVTGVAYFDSTNFTAAGDGKVSITNGTITNAQLANSSISFAGGGSPSSVSLGGTLTITGTTNEVKVTNSGSGTLTLGLPTDVVIGGNLTVNGTVITANVENFVVEDPLIALGTGNAADSVDLGWYGMYTSGSLRYAGTFRDASDGGKFKFFGGLTAQPSATINTSAATYATATIVANIDGGTF